MGYCVSFFVDGEVVNDSSVRCRVKFSQMGEISSVFLGLLACIVLCNRVK